MFATSQKMSHHFAKPETVFLCGAGSDCERASAAVGSAGSAPLAAAPGTSPVVSPGLRPLEVPFLRLKNVL